AQSTSVLPLNQWSHVAGTFDGLTVAIFVNGVMEASASYPTNHSIYPGTNDLAIGGVVGGAAPGQVISAFAGRIDEPSVYGHALTAAEIMAIYNAGNAGKCPTGAPPTNCTPPASGIAACW